MKPGRREIRHTFLITGDELRELKRNTGSMAEAFGPDAADHLAGDSLRGGTFTESVT
jgi:hypothetical protein